jgi:hypothetical protein
MAKEAYNTAKETYDILADLRAILEDADLGRWFGLASDRGVARAGGRATSCPATLRVRFPFPSTSLVCV